MKQSPVYQMFELEAIQYAFERDWGNGDSESCE